MSTRTADPAWGPNDKHELLNTDIPRVDGPLKVTGHALYTHDIRLPGMLYARLFVAPHPTGEVLSMDFSKALAIEGVEACVSLVESRWSYLGEPLAAVAAKTPDLCDDAIEAIEAELLEGDWVVTREQALEEGAAQVTRRGNVTGRGDSGDKEKAEAALEGSDVTVEAEYELPVQHHSSLETHGVVVDFRGDEATVYASTQATSILNREAAQHLGIPASKIRIVVDHMGGGFGSKFSMGIEGRAACLLARETERPVHLMCTRPHEFLLTGNRSGSWQKWRAGATKDGRLTGLVAEVVKLGGLGRGSAAGQPYIYRDAWEATYAETYSVHTHTDASRAFRAPGHPQSSFGIESVIDELAYAAGVDPLEMRLKNLPDNAYQRQLKRVAEEIGWSSHPNRTAPGDGSTDGIGFGVATWGGAGQARTGVDLRIDVDGSVTASVGSQDIGTGVKTYIAAIVAQELGLPLDAVEPRVGDSTYPFGFPSGGSVTTPTLAPAVKDAAHQARERLAEHLAELLEVPAADIRFEGGRVLGAGSPIEWREACETLGSPLEVQGQWRQGLSSGGIQGAQAARVHVDVLTGRVTMVKMVAIQNQGLPLNRLALRSQINGGMIQALSYGLLEERVIDPDLGVMLNANFEDYKIAGSREIPEMVSIIDDEDDRQAVIGMAEATIIPGHCAIANAIYNACGARLRTTPFTPDRVLAALAERG